MDQVLPTMGPIGGTLDGLDVLREGIDKQDLLKGICGVYTGNCIILTAPLSSDTANEDNESCEEYSCSFSVKLLF